MSATILRRAAAVAIAVAASAPGLAVAQQPLAQRDGQMAEMVPWAPFARAVFDLEESRRRLEAPDPAAAAATLARQARIVALRTGRWRSP